MMTIESTAPRPFAIAGSVLVLVAGCCLAVSVALLGIEPNWLLLMILMFALLSENFALVIGGYSISVAMPLAVAAMVLQGPVAAALVSGLSSVNLQSFRSKRQIALFMFNTGQVVLVSLAAGWTYLLLSDGRMLQGDPLKGDDFPSILVALAVAATVAAVGNVVMTSAGIALMYNGRFSASMSSAFPHVPSFLALVSVGYLMAQVAATETVSLALFIFPLVVARDLYQRFKSLKDAYSDTIRSLVRVLEAKDPYTRGHSERVSQYAVQIGRALQLDSRSCERLEYAGLLHDLGKIALSRQLLTKPGALSDDEMALMRNHPSTGASLVQRIPQLADLAELVTQHHERYAGGGYPYGLTHSQTNMLSRVLTVADAYDAMTTNRSYRAAMPHSLASTILKQESGLQFDPDVVAAFERSGAAAAPQLEPQQALEDVVDESRN